MTNELVNRTLTMFDILIGAHYNSVPAKCFVYIIQPFREFYDTDATYLNLVLLNLERLFVLYNWTAEFATFPTIFAPLLQLMKHTTKGYWIYLTYLKSVTLRDKSTKHSSWLVGLFCSKLVHDHITYIHKTYMIMYKHYNYSPFVCKVDWETPFFILYRVHNLKVNSNSKNKC